MAVHVRDNSCYISFPSSAKKKNNVKGQLFLTTGPSTANFSYFYLKLNALVASSAGATFNTIQHSE